jgi:methionyl-tRNA formyltransferase
MLIGLGPTGPSALESLTEVCDVLCVVRTLYDDPASADPTETWSVREWENWVPGRRPGDPPDDLIAQRARSLGIQLCADTSPRAIEELVGRLRPDCVVVSSYNRILGSRLLGLSKFVNVHYTPLPKYRGRGDWALINGEPFTAITIHAIDAGLDTGNVLFQELVPICGTDTIADLFERMNGLQHRHLGDTVLRFLAGYEGLPQRHEAATYGCANDIEVPEDGEIDWSAPTSTIDHLIRGLAYPFPGAYTYLGGRWLAVWRAETIVDGPHYAGRVPGRVVAVSRSKGFVDVLTGDGILRLHEVQVRGQRRVPAATLIQSVTATLGIRTVDLLARLEALEGQVTRLLEAQAIDER